MMLFGSPFPTVYRIGRVRCTCVSERPSEAPRGRAIAGSVAEGVEYIRSRARARLATPAERQRSSSRATDAGSRTRRSLPSSAIEPRILRRAGRRVFPERGLAPLGRSARRLEAGGRQVVEHVGPDGCDGDDMLREPHVPRSRRPCGCGHFRDEEDGHAAGLIRSTATRGSAATGSSVSISRPLRPVIADRRDFALGRLGRWSPQFFKEEYGDLEVEVDGETMALGDLIDRVEASTDDNPAPYLRNQALAEWPPELSADVLPDARLHAAQLAREPRLPKGENLRLSRCTSGAGRAVSRSPLRRPSHPCVPDAAIRRQGIHRVQPRADPVHVPAGWHPGRTSPASSTCSIPTLRSSRCSTRPRASAFSFIPARRSSCPSGWWHTARILSPSVTVSINGVNRANSAAFRRDYCESLAQRSKALSLVAQAGLVFGQTTHLFEFKYLNRRRLEEPVSLD